MPSNVKSGNGKTRRNKPAQKLKQVEGNSMNIEFLRELPVSRSQNVKISLSEGSSFSRIDVAVV